VAFLHDFLFGPDAVASVVKVPSEENKGDVHTKVLERVKWIRAMVMLGAVLND
jgi:hypothetical protein